MAGSNDVRILIWMDSHYETGEPMWANGTFDTVKAEGYLDIVWLDRIREDGDQDEILEQLAEAVKPSTLQTQVAQWWTIEQQWEDDGNGHMYPGLRVVAAGEVLE